MWGGKFKGWTSFYICPGSKVEIGCNATFNSNIHTNHIGLNHRCILATHLKTAQIIIGHKFGISSSSINCWDKIIIGNNVRVGANCIIMDADFHLDDSRIDKPKPVIIGDGVWLGANVVVAKGVTIGNNSIIGINSVVTKDIPSNCIAAGNPCKPIRYI